MPKDDRSELFIVVDKEDNILYPLERGKVHSNRKYIHRSVGIVIYNQAGKILLQKRSESKDIEPGKWTISVSGHVNWGQEYRETAERELKEEIGIETKLSLVKKILTEDSRELEWTEIYEGKVTADMEFVLDIDEVANVSWVSKKELRKYIDNGLLTKYAETILRELNLLKL